MTREDAIIRLKKGEPFSEIYDPVWDEALKMAISALSDYDKMQKISLDLAFENDELINKMNELSADGDCISRQVVIEAITKTSGIRGDALKALYDLPSIENKGEWIPVKWHTISDEEREREGYPEEWVTILDCSMPQDHEEVLVTVKSRTGRHYVETDICFFDGGEYSSDNGYDWIEDIVAWMPLPEPYKAEKGGE